jgi:glucose-6-phosphate dehydrogenase assembly protein OpcA
VSALAGGPDTTSEHTTWRGEDVELDMVVERLLRMNGDHARHVHGHAATRTLNLLVACGGDVEEELLARRLEGARVRHPSRTIVLREHAQDRLDARILIDCDVGATPGVVGSCHDRVVLVADAARLRHADSLVHALRVGGLPSVLWLPGAAESAAERALAPRCDAILLDTAAAPGADALRAAVARARRLGAAAHVRDFAWLRLARWRQRVATRFDAPAALALLDAATRLEIRCSGPDDATPLLLASWLAARARWRLTRLARADGAWRTLARREDGGEVELAIGRCDANGPAGVHALTLSAHDDVLELVEPVAEPDVARTFAAALSTFDAPAGGYAAALATLSDGLEPA